MALTNVVLFASPDLVAWPTACKHRGTAIVLLAIIKAQMKHTELSKPHLKHGR